MSLTKDQIAELKKQLSAQIQHLPTEQKAEAQKQIDEMSDEAIETMLQTQQESTPQEPLFRSIVNEKIPSKKISDNKEAIAVLDIRPISLGHTVVIPRKAAHKSSDLSTTCFSLAKKISSRIIRVLKAKGTEIQTEFKFGEMIINIIPVYDKPLSLNSPRADSNPEVLSNIFNKLKDKKKTIKMSKLKPASKTKKYSTTRIARRIP